MKQSTRRTQQAMPKRPQASASQDETSPKKTRKESEATVLARMPKIIPTDTEEQEEEEEKEEVVSALLPLGLRSRSHAILVEVELVGQSVMAEGTVVVEQPAI